MSRYTITIYIEGPKAKSVFDLLTRIPVFAALSKVTGQAGYHVVGYTAKPEER